jgi:hypothetical protein
MIAVPGATPVTKPVDELTEAIAALLVLQVAETPLKVLLLNAVVVVGQTASVPVMVPPLGRELTVIALVTKLVSPPAVVK